METLEVGGRVEALELQGFEALEPGDVEVLDDVVRDVVAGIERMDDAWQRRLAIGATNGLEQSVVTGDSGIAAARSGNRQLGRRALNVWHVACHGEQHLVVSREQPRLQTRERTRVRLAVE